MQFETDRAKFLGRDRNLRNPISIIDGRPLSNTAGSVLDPAISLRRTVRVPAGKTVRLEQIGVTHTPTVTNLWYRVTAWQGPVPERP